MVIEIHSQKLTMILGFCGTGTKSTFITNLDRRNIWERPLFN